MKRFMGLTLLMTVTMICGAIQFMPGGATKAATPGDDRIRATLDKIGWRYEVDKDGDFKVTIKTEDDMAIALTALSADGIEKSLTQADKF
jgi:hypothetical protein